MRYSPATILLIGLAMAACDAVQSDQSTSAPAVAPVEATQVQAPAEIGRAEIDWAQARQDFAARNTGDDTTLSIAGSSNPPVPVLLPDQPVGVARSGGSNLQFRPTADGYFAVLPGETYDLIINGSDRLVPGIREGTTPAVEDLFFQETLTGAQVSFRRYGASYLAEFMCKAPNTAIVGSCISEEDAQQVVRDLLISGTR